MARFTSSTFGKISGKHGTAVAAVRKDGLCILKEYRVASNPNTIGQKNQRGKFGFVMKEINCLRAVFTRNFGGQYGINKVVAIAMKTAVTGEFPDFQLDYSKLEVASGSLSNNSNAMLVRWNENILQLSWNTNSISNGSPDDKVNFIFLNSLNKFVIERYECASRSVGKIETEIPANWSISDIHAWIYFSSADNKLISRSQYILPNP
ncbi:MAG: DUF6266 family protein [Paludibacteraceae bacterium]